MVDSQDKKARVALENVPRSHIALPHLVCFQDAFNKYSLRVCANRLKNDGMRKGFVQASLGTVLLQAIKNFIPRHPGFRMHLPEIAHHDRSVHDQ